MNNCNVATNADVTFFRKLMPNPMRISTQELAKRNGFDNPEDMVFAIGHDSTLPACCDEECIVEPDGRCEHGCPSLLVAMGLI
jgi:hypothetical protein